MLRWSKPLYSRKIPIHYFYFVRVYAKIADKTELFKLSISTFLFITFLLLLILLIKFDKNSGMKFYNLIN